AGVLVDQLAGHRAPGYPQVDLGRDLEGERLVVHASDRSVDPADGHDLVAHVDALEQRTLLAASALLRSDQEEVEGRSQDDDEADEAQATAAARRGRRRRLERSEHGNRPLSARRRRRNGQAGGPKKTAARGRQETAQPVYGAVQTFAIEGGGRRQVAM